MSKTNISTRQQEIIEASGNILITKGIKGLTIKNLALEMRFSESAIYRHFSNKEDIIVLLFSTMLENFKLRLNEIMLRDLEPIEKLEALFESQFEYISHNPHFTVTVLSDDIYFEGPRVQEALHKIFAYISGIVLRILEKGKADGEIRTDIDNEHLLHTIIGSYRLQMLKWRYDNFTFDLQEEGKKMKDTLILLIKNKK